MIAQGAGAGAAALAVWLYLLLGRGGFWRMRDFRPETKPVYPAPKVTAVVPARNEAAVIRSAVPTLVKQKYAGEFHVIVVDDSSTDGTAAAARSAAADSPLTVISAPPPEPGWTGKLWAVSRGIEAAQRGAPDYLLLTDADIVHPPDNLSSLVALAEAEGYGLVSLMVRLQCRSLAERALIPAFVFFFFLFYPPAWIRSGSHRTAGAAGGCILIRRNWLERIGGLERIRGALIDDCALARAVKDAGGRVWLGLGGGAESIRKYQTFGQIGAVIARTAFTQLRHSVLLLMGTLAGLTLTYLAPPLLAISGNAWAAGAWLLMSLSYVPVLRFYGRSVLWAPLLPLVAAFYMACTVYSAVAYWRGRGGMWKGRVQDAG